MKVVIILLIHLVLRTQNAEAKEIVPIKSYLAQLPQDEINTIEAIQSKEPINIELNRLRSINDLRDKIKNSITNAWNAIKEIANKIKERINGWRQNIKKRAEEALKAFRVKLEILKQNFNNFIKKVKKIAGDVKQCIHDDKDSIHQLLKQIAKNVATCIANSVKKADALDDHQSKLKLDDSEFNNQAEDKLNRCVQNLDEADECLNKARGEIYDDMEQNETGIMDTRSMSRNLVEVVLETITQCTVDGLAEASEAIAQEVIKITNCVVSQNQKPFLLN